MAGRRWQAESGRQKVAGRKWQAESGRQMVAGIEWKAEGGRQASSKTDSLTGGETGRGKCRPAAKMWAASSQQEDMKAFFIGRHNDTKANWQAGW